MELLLYCARTHVDPARADRIQVLLDGKIEWEHLLGLANKHELGSLLDWQLNNTCPEAVPEKYLSRLQHHFHANTRRNLYLSGELLRVLDILGNHGIAAVPFRGPILAASYYGHLGLREFGDLDLLVHKSEAPRIDEMLANEGYYPLTRLSRAQRAAIHESEHHLHLQSDSGDTHLEIHWRVVPRYLFPRFESETLWGRLEEVSIGGTSVSTFSPEDLLIVLCLHEASHTWERLAWICDTSELIRSEVDLDWDDVLRRAEAIRCERVVFIGLLLAHDLLGTVLPAEIIYKATGDSAAQVIAHQVKRRIFEGVSGSPLFLIRATDRALDKIELAARIARNSVVPTPAEWAVLPLPPALDFLYWIIRPVRLFVVYVLSPLTRRVVSVFKRV